MTSSNERVLQRILSLVKDVLGQDRSVSECIAALSKEGIREHLCTDVVISLDSTARALSKQAPSTALIVSLTSIEAAKISGDKEALIECYYTCGDICLATGDYRTARRMFQKVVGHFKDAPDSDWYLSGLVQLGWSLANLGESEEAKSNILLGLRLAQRLGSRQRIAEALGQIAAVYYQLGDMEVAVDHAEQAIALLPENHNPMLKVKMSTMLGLYLANAGRSEEAIELLAPLLSERQKAGDRVGSKVLYCNLGIALRLSGDFSRAIECHHNAIEICQEFGDPRGTGDNHGNLAIIYGQLRDSELALSHNDEALKRYRSCGYRKGLADCLGNQGIYLIGRRQYEQASKCFAESLEISRQLGDRFGEAARLGNLGTIYAMTDKSQEALDVLSRSNEVSKAIGDQLGVAASLAQMGAVLGSMARFDEGIERLQHAKEIAQRIGDLGISRFTSSKLGFIYCFCLESPEVALQHYEEAIRWSGVQRRLIKDESDRIRVFTDQESDFDAIILLCKSMEPSIPGKILESIRYLEEAKSRTLIESMMHTSIQPVHSVDRDLLAREGVLLRKLQSLYFAGLKRQRASLDELERCENELSKVWSEIEEVDPEYVSLRRGRPLDFGQIQSLISAQGDGACLVEYFFSSDKLLIFILRSDNPELQVEEVDLPADRLDYYLKHYSDEFLNPQMGQHDLGQVWQGLSKYLVDPVIKHLDGIETIYLVPFRQLHYLPLHALRHNGRYLIEQYKIVYSPSASVRPRRVIRNI